MSLIEIQSKEETDEYKTAVDRAEVSGNAFWMGSERDAIDNSFRWNSNGETIRYENFKEGEPNNYGNIENCMFVWIDGDKYYWNDCPCASEGLVFGAACYRPKYLRKCVVLPNYSFLYVTKALVREQNQV